MNPVQAIIALAAVLLHCAMALAQEPPPQHKLELELGKSVEHLTGGRGDWRSTHLNGKLGNGETRQTYFWRLRNTERFGLADDELAVGTYQPFGRVWGAMVEASASPTHHVLAKTTLLAQLERRFDNGWGAQLGYRRSQYSLGGTDLAIATVERYFSDFRVAYSFYLGRPDGAAAGAAHRLQSAYYYSDQSFFGISAWAGKELENIVPGGVLTSRVRGASLAGRHEFAPGWAATYEVFSHRQGGLYSRRGLSIGLRHLF